MRIRQVKPAFWTDPTIAKASYPARLFYIGLWCVADDAGYIDWEPLEIGALLFPYETPRVRERHISSWTNELTASGRLVLQECGCAVIPTMPNHQRIAGKQSFAVRDKHDRLHRGRIHPGSIAESPTGETVTSHAQNAHPAAHRSGSGKHPVAASGSQVLTDSPGTVGNGIGTVGNVTVRNGSARDIEEETTGASEFQLLVPRPAAIA